MTQMKLEELNSPEDFRVMLHRVLADTNDDDPSPANSRTKLATLDPGTVISVSEILGNFNSSLAKMSTENDGTRNNSSAAPTGVSLQKGAPLETLLKTGVSLETLLQKGVARETLGIGLELETALQAMEARRATMTQDNAYLVKKLKEFEQKYKPLQEKNKKFLEKNMELTTANRNLKDENGNITEENKKLKDQLENCRRKSSQLTRQLTLEKMEHESLEMRLADMENLRKQVSELEKTIAGLKQVCAEKDRRMEVLQHRKNRRLRMSPSQMARVGSPNCTLEDDTSLNSSHSSISMGTISDEDLLEEQQPREEVEKNYRKLMKEQLLMEKSMAQLQGTLGCHTDPQRYNKLKSDLEMDLFIAQCRIETLESSLKKQQEEDYSWVVEKDQLCAENQAMLQQILELTHNLDESREQTENLEFLVLESQESQEKHKQAPTCDVATETVDGPSTECDHPEPCAREVEEKLSREITQLHHSEAALRAQLEMAQKGQEDYRGQIQGLEEKLSRLLEGKGPEGEMAIAQLKSAEKHVIDLEGTMQELQSKVIHLQQDKSELSERLSKYKDRLDSQEKSLALTRDEREELLQVKCKTPDQQLNDRLKLAERGGQETKERTPRFIYVDYGTPHLLADRAASTPRLSPLDLSHGETPRISPLDGFDTPVYCSPYELGRESPDAEKSEEEKPFGSETDLERNQSTPSYLHVDVLREVDRLQKQVAELQDENDVLRYELAHKAGSDNSGSDSEEPQLVELRSTVEFLREKVHSAEVTEKQNRDRLKLAERTINELEASEGLLRDKYDETMKDCDKLRKQLVRLQRKIKDLKDMNSEKEAGEQILLEKVQFFEEAEVVNSRRISELEDMNQMLQQRMDLKDELIADVHLVESLKVKVVSLEAENGELGAKLVELEEDNEILRDNWKKVADEEANRRECLEEKVNSLKSANKELQSKLREKENDIDLNTSGQSLASEISNQTIEQLNERIQELEDELQKVSEDKNSKIESLQENLVNLKENEVKLSETVKEMECSEKQFKSQIALLENTNSQTHEVVSRMLSYEGKINKLKSSQEDLLEELDSMEDHEDDLKERLRVTELKFQRKIELLEREIAEYQSQEEEMVVAMEDMENREKEYQSRIQELEDAETSLTVRFSHRVEELEQNQSEMTDNYESRIQELQASESELQSSVQTLENEKKDLSSKLADIELEKEEMSGRIEALEDTVKDLEIHEKEVSEKFLRRIGELEKHEQELMEKVETLEKPASQEHSQHILSVSSNEQARMELTSKLESFAKFEKESEEKLTLADTGEFQSIQEQNNKYREEISELKGRLEEHEELNNDLRHKIQVAEKEQKALTDKLKKQEKKRKKSERSDNWEDYDSLAREVVTYKVEVEQLRSENTELHERLMELDDSEKQLQEHNEELEKEVEKFSNLSEKLNVLQDAEGKFMDRISELEEIETNLRDQLSRKSNNLDTDRRQSSAESAYESGNDTPAVETTDKSVGTSDFMEGVMGNAEPGKPVSSMFERIQALEAENQEYATKLSMLTATDAQVRQLSEKVKFLEQSEDSLMERVMELEEQEDQLRRDLNKARRSVTSVTDLEEELNDLQDREQDLSEKVEQLEHEKVSLRKSMELSGSERNDFAVRLSSLQILYEEEKKKVEILLKGEERLMKSLSSEKKAVKELEQELLNTQEKLEELQTEYEQKLSEKDDSEKQVKEELNKQLREKEVFRKKLKEFEKSNGELEDEIEACKISESRMFHRHQQLITQNEELEAKVAKLAAMVSTSGGQDAVNVTDSADKDKPHDSPLKMSENPEVVSENPMNASVFSEEELVLLRKQGEIIDTELLGAVPLDMLRKMKEFDAREMSYQSKIEELEHKNVKLVRKMKVLHSKEKDLKSEIKELQVELLNYRESTSSFRASSSSLDLDKSVSDDGTDSDNLSDTPDMHSSDHVFQSNSSQSGQDNQTKEQSLLTIKLFEKRQSQDAEKISHLEGQMSEVQEVVQEVVAMVATESLESFLVKVNAFQEAKSERPLWDSVYQQLMMILEKHTDIRQRFEALHASEGKLRVALAESEIGIDKLSRHSAEKIKQLEAQIFVLAKLGDKYPPTADRPVTESVVEPAQAVSVEAGNQSPRQEDSLWQKLESSDARRVTSPGRDLVLETSKTINIDVPPTPQNDVCYLGQSETIKVNVPPTGEYLLELEELEDSYDYSPSMMDKPEDVLRARIRELEKLEKHLKQQVYDVERDREELHNIARKDKNIIHEQNVRIRELQLAEQNLQLQLENFEAKENVMYAQLDELENVNSRYQDRIRDLEILEGRLKDLVKKYKLDGKILETKSTTLESSMQELSAKEENLKQKVQNLETEKTAFSERSDYLQGRLKELETAEVDLSQRTKNQENIVQTLQARAIELEMFGVNAQARIAELEAMNMEMSARLHHAMTENSPLTQHATELQNRVLDLESELKTLRDSDVQLKQENKSLQESEGELQGSRKDHRLREVELQARIRQLEECEASLKAKLSRLQRTENTLKYRVQELENAGLQAPDDHDSSSQREASKLPRNLEDCQRRIISLQSSNAELQSRLQQYQRVSGTRAMVQMPQAEYQELQMKAGLLEQTEAQMSESDRLNVNLQQTVQQLREGKDVCGHDVEVEVLRKRLDQSQKSIQMLRTQGPSGQWKLQGQNVAQPNGGYTGGNVAPTSSHLNEDMIQDVIRQLPGDEEWLTLPQGGLPHTQGGAAEETIQKTQTGRVQSQPTGQMLSRDRMISDLMQGLEAPTLGGPEAQHWRDIESRLPEASSGGEAWINVGTATSLYAANPQLQSHRNDEELEVGVNLPSETESQMYSQNDTDSGRYAPHVRQQNRDLYMQPMVNGSVTAAHHAPTLPRSGPQAGVKVTDSFAISQNSQSMPASMLDSVEEMSDPSREVLLRRGGHIRGLNNALPRASALSVESVADSGRGTASVSMATSGLTLQERIAHIERQLSTRETDSGREFHEMDPSAWRARFQDSNRKLELAEKDNKSLKDEALRQRPAYRRKLKINKLEKELEEKTRLYLILEAFLESVESLVNDKNIGSEEARKEELQKEVVKTRNLLESGGQRPSDISNDPAALNAEMAKKERELTAKRNEVDSLMRELRQWQEECRTIEDMRANALDSLRGFEVEVAELQNADKQLKELKDEYNNLRGQFMRLFKAYKKLEETCTKLDAVSKEKDDLDIEATGLRSRVRLLEGQIKVYEEVSEEKTDLVKQVSDLKFAVKDFQSLEKDYATLEDKLLGTTDVLNERIRKVEELTEEIFLLRNKVTKLEKENYKLRQGGTTPDHVKSRVDDLEHAKSKLQLSVTPLRSKIVQLTHLCNEKDVMIKKLVQELKSGSKHSPLLEDLMRLENNEDFNHNRLGRSSSQSSLSSGDPVIYLSDTEILRDSSPRNLTRPRSADPYQRHPPSRRHGNTHLPQISRHNQSPRVGPVLDSKTMPVNTQFIAVADYDPSIFSRSGRERLELTLKEGDLVTVTGPLDDKGYYEAEVNGHVGLVPSNYIQPVMGKHRAGKQLGVPGYLDGSPEKIAQMYQQLHSAHQADLHAGKPRMLPVNGVANDNMEKQLGGPPAVPSDFHVDKIIGNSSLMLSWRPVPLDDQGCSNGVKVVGYRVFKDNKVLFHPTSPQQSKAVVESLDIHAHHRFGIQATSVDGQVSELSEIMYEGVEEVTSDENSDTESEMDMSSLIDADEYKTGPKRMFMGVYDYDPNKNSPQDHPSCELSFKAGDVIAVFGRQRADGFYHGEINGHRGLVPTFFIEEVPQAPPRTKKNVTKGKKVSKDSQSTTENQKNR